MIDPQDLLDGPAASASEVLDCVVVGGGPAGLTAGVYLRRFHRTLRVVDAGASRARRIPRSHNVPGFPEGVAGVQLLKLMRTHLAQVGGELIEDAVVRVTRRSDGLFAVYLAGQRLWARTLLFCTGVKERLPALAGVAQLEAEYLLRSCPVCDGYEFSDQRIGVIGNSAHGVREAAFLRHFSDKVRFIEIDGRVGDLGPALLAAGVRQLAGVARQVAVAPDRELVVTMDDGQAHRFDVLYAGLGVDPRTALAVSLGVRLDGAGNVITDSRCCTNVNDVFAAGDVVSALDQIAVAVGHAAIAATAIHNSL